MTEDSASTMSVFILEILQKSMCFEKVPLAYTYKSLNEQKICCAQQDAPYHVSEINVRIILFAGCSKVYQKSQSSKRMLDGR